MRDKSTKALQKKHVYENLANAIVVQACQDYRKALKRPGKPENRKTIKELQGFFKSGWFKCLTDVDGKRLARLIEEESRENLARVEKFKK